MKDKSERREISCTVVSDKMNKSRVGLLERRVKHPRVGKYIRRSTKFMFHDESNKSKLGDEVVIVSTRSLSKRKSYELLKVSSVAE